MCVTRCSVARNVEFGPLLLRTIPYVKFLGRAIKAEEGRKIAAKVRERPSEKLAYENLGVPLSD